MITSFDVDSKALRWVANASPPNNKKGFTGITFLDNGIWLVATDMRRCHLKLITDCQELQYETPEPTPLNLMEIYNECQLRDGKRAFFDFNTEKALVTVSIGDRFPVHKVDLSPINIEPVDVTLKGLDKACDFLDKTPCHQFSLQNKFLIQALRAPFPMTFKSFCKGDGRPVKFYGVDNDNSIWMAVIASVLTDRRVV